MYEFLNVFKFLFFNIIFNIVKIKKLEMNKFFVFYFIDYLRYFGY